MDVNKSASLQERVQAVYEHVLSVSEDVSPLDARWIDVRRRAVQLVDGPAELEHTSRAVVVVIN